MTRKMLKFIISLFHLFSKAFLMLKNIERPLALIDITVQHINVGIEDDIK